MSDKPVPGLPGQSRRLKPLSEPLQKQLENVLRKAASLGYVDVTSHFTARAAERGFTTVEALNVLKGGVLKCPPLFCAEFCNWKFLVSGEHDEGRLVVAAAVCAGEEGQLWSSSVPLITGYIR